MTGPTNSMCHGSAAVTDVDLLEMDLTYGVTLPWVIGLVAEVQYFRDLADRAVQTTRVEYLEGVLNDIGAKYDAETD